MIPKEEKETVNAAPAAENLPAESEPEKNLPTEAPEEETPEEASPPGDEHRNKKEERTLKKECAALKKECEAQKKELAKLKKDLEEKAENERAQNERYLRMMAEYDNFRRRSAAEKDNIYTDACTDVLTEILPVVDALELAVKYGGDGEKVLQGVQMTLNKFNEVLGKLGVSPVETDTFDPNIHNAVMHVEDADHGEGEILEVFQKGYKKGDKVIRYAMVKVAN